MKKHYLSPYLFFNIENGQVLIWNYKTHDQFLLEKEYFETLLEISKSGYSSNDSIVRELLEEKVLVTEPIELDWEWDDLSKMFHIGTQNITTANIGLEEILDHDTFAKLYMDECADLGKMPDFFIERKGPLMDLPEPDPTILQKNSFYDVLLQRKTSRSFYGKSIPLSELSTILFYSFGLPHGKEWKELTEIGILQTGLHKTSPSGGARHPEEAYLVAYRVDDLSPGLYHYRPQDHKLTLLKEGDFEKKVIIMNNNQPFSQGLAFGVYVVAEFYRTWWKYSHSQAYRVVLFDTALVSQTFLLCATAHGLQTWITVAFRDKEIEEFLEINSPKESPMIYVAAGIGSGQAIPEGVIRQLKQN